MAIDTRNKRASAFSLAGFIYTLPHPDGVVDKYDRVHAAWLYSGLIVGVRFLDYTKVSLKSFLRFTAIGVKTLQQFTGIEKWQ